MSSYLQKYHRRKVEPVLTRAPRVPYVEYIKGNQEKATTVKLSKEREKKKRETSYSRETQNRESAGKGQPKLQKHQKADPEQLSLEGKKPEKNVDHREVRIHEEAGLHRAKSLHFKKLNEDKGNFNILSTLQNFFNKIMRSDEGCQCEQPCSYALQLFKWSDVPLEIATKHYESILAEVGDLEELAIRPSPEMASKEVAKIKEKRKQLKQIEIDIARTQSENDTFQNQEFKGKMRRILMCYAEYDKEVGYVQGMNMILSGVLFHVKDEVKTYAVFRKLIHSMRGVYLKSFAECYEHIAKIQRLLHASVRDLYNLMAELSVDLRVICLPWVISLMTSVVPLEQLHLIYLGYIKNKWSFIYKVVLALLVYHKEVIKEMEDSGDVMALLSPSNPNREWIEIIAYAQTISL